MANLKDLTTGQIQRIIALKEQIEELQRQIDSIGGRSLPRPLTAKKSRRRMSAAGRARIGAAAKARWAKYRSKAATKSEKPTKKRRKVSPAVKAKLAAIARARWAKVKAAGKKTL